MTKYFTYLRYCGIHFLPNFLRVFAYTSKKKKKYECLMYNIKKYNIMFYCITSITQLKNATSVSIHDPQVLIYNFVYGNINSPERNKPITEQK